MVPHTDPTGATAVARPTDPTGGGGDDGGGADSSDTFGMCHWLECRVVCDGCQCAVKLSGGW